MQVRAERSFSGRMGYIEHGTVCTLPDGYAQDLIRNGLVSRFVPSNLAGEDDKADREPPDNRNLGDAPRNKDNAPGNGEGGQGGPPASTAQVSPPAGGLGITSQSLRRGRRSGSKT